MNAYEELCDFVAGDIEANAYGVTIKNCDDVEASISLDENIIYFPYYIETLNILYELGDIKSLVGFVLANKLLYCDEYDLCEELLSKLTPVEEVKCESSVELYKTLVVKEFFALYHEIGHYIINKKKETKDYLFEVVDRAIAACDDFDENDTSFLGILTDLYVENDVMKNIMKEYHSFLKESNNEEFLSEFFKNESQKEEVAADLFAFKMMSHYLNKEYINNGIIKKAFNDFINMINIFSSIERNVYDDQYKHLSIDDDSDEIIKTLLTKSLSPRIIVDGIMVDNYFEQEESEPSTFDVLSDIFKKQNMFAEVSNNPEYVRFAQAYYDSSSIDYSEEKRVSLKLRLDEYANKLRQLYQIG